MRLRGDLSRLILSDEHVEATLRRDDEQSKYKNRAKDSIFHTSIEYYFTQRIPSILTPRRYIVNHLHFWQCIFERFTTIHPCPWPPHLSRGCDVVGARLADPSWLHVARRRQAVRKSHRLRAQLRRAVTVRVVRDRHAGGVAAHVLVTHVGQVLRHIRDAEGRRVPHEVISRATGRTSFGAAEKPTTHTGTNNIAR